jgi:TRAP-type mannitol/chloroaromatic compound transport system permease large subunit
VDGLGPHRHSLLPRIMTPRLKQMLAIAESEVARAKHLTIPQSLLLGIVIEGRGVATKVLKSVGFDLGHLRESLLEVPNKSDTGDPG